jgi:catechol 2,3-dioxygenase
VTTDPAVTVRFSHMGIGCRDVSVMVDFYTRVLGMVVSDTGRVDFGQVVDIAFLTADPTEHHQLVLVGGRQAIDNDTSPVSGGVVGPQLFQISFGVSSLGGLRSVLARLEGEGIAKITAMNHGNAWSIYTRDPEGNALECYVKSPWYVAQPCALPLDLDQPDEVIMQVTRQYCESQPEGSDYAEWSARTAERIAHQQRSFEGAH